MKTFVIGYYEEQTIKSKGASLRVGGALRWATVQAENEEEAKLAIIKKVDGQISKFHIVKEAGK